MDRELFDKLEGTMSRSDMFYVDLIGDLVVAIDDVIEAFTDRNPEKIVNKFILSTIAGIVNTIFKDKIKVDNSQLLNATTAFLCVVTGGKPEDYIIDGEDEI